MWDFSPIGRACWREPSSWSRPISPFASTSGRRRALLIAWNVGAWAFLVMIAAMVADPKRDARVQARPEDENQWVLVLLGDCGGFAAIAAIVWELGPVKDMTGWSKVGTFGARRRDRVERLDLPSGDVCVALCRRLFRATRAGFMAASSFRGRLSQAGWNSSIRPSSSAAPSPQPDVNVTSKRMRRIVRHSGRRRLLLQRDHPRPRHQRHRKPLLIGAFTRDVADIAAAQGCRAAVSRKCADGITVMGPFEIVLGSLAIRRGSCCTDAHFRRRPMMRLSDLASIGSLISSAAVVISLVSPRVLQIRQSGARTTNEL